MNEWIDIKNDLPENPGYYDVLFDTGFTGEHQFRKRTSKKETGFLTFGNVVAWRYHIHSQEEINAWDVGLN